MTTETQIERGETQWVTRGDDTKAGHHLSRFGVFGTMAYREAMASANPQDTVEMMRTRLESLPTDAENMTARAYAEAALGMVDTDLAAKQWFSPERCAAEYAVITAMHTMDKERWPAPATVIEQPECCRHGVAFSADCPACDADFA